MKVKGKHTPRNLSLGLLVLQSGYQCTNSSVLIMRVEQELHANNKRNTLEGCWTHPDYRGALRTIDEFIELSYYRMRRFDPGIK